jgi:hypothetical protein
MVKYDFNNKDKQILIDDSKKDKNDKIFSQSNISKENETNEDKENNNIDNIDKIEINNKIEEEEISKKYKITFFGENIMNLPKNYSTDDEDEYKFINLMNEPNDSYELAVDSKIIKVYAKIVS